MNNVINSINYTICPINVIAKQVSDALIEDLSLLGQDFTASLIKDKHVKAIIKTNDNMIMCGKKWADMTFSLYDPNVLIKWLVDEGDAVTAGSSICEITGMAKTILTVERTVLNFLQTLSAVASCTRKYVDLVAGTKAKIIDTRKTIPGLRLAQKYAVTVGGGYNQRLGLYDGVLIKENHIMAYGGVSAVVKHALSLIPSYIPIQIEVEDFNQLVEALEAGAKNILLDNMMPDLIRKCVIYANNKAEIEVSGNINLSNVLNYALCGVDRISIGSLTKSIQAIDLSMRVVE